MQGIVETHESEFDRIIEVWESAVRATHDFLQEADIVAMRPQIRYGYLQAVKLRVFKDEHAVIQGFLGVSEGNVDMLFVAADAHGKGIGKALMQYAVQHMGATKVDVNEQNPGALAFYHKQGFEVVSRSTHDSQGNPFPLLHMALSSSRA